jgi:hypothetical protein
VLATATICATVLAFPHGLGRDEPLMHEHEEEGAEQELVRNGIQVFAEAGALLQDPREQAVQTIADAGQDEEREGRTIAGVQHGDDEERNDAEAQERQLIRCGAEVFQHWLRVTSIK